MKPDSSHSYPSFSYMALIPDASLASLPFIPISRSWYLLEKFNLDVLNHPRIHRLLKPATRVLIKRMRGITLRASLAIIGIRLLQRLRANSLIIRRQEDNLAIRRLRHGLHSLKISDLHRGSRAQDIGGLAHEFRGLDFGAGGDDFGLADALGLGGHAEGVLQLVAEDDVFDEHALDLDAPAAGDVFDDLAD